MVLILPSSAFFLFALLQWLQPPVKGSEAMTMDIFALDLLVGQIHPFTIFAGEFFFVGVHYQAREIPFKF